MTRSATPGSPPPPTPALALALCLALPAGGAGSSAETGPPPVDFSRQIRPILAETCLLCHGPDSEGRKAKLRLDRREEATADRGGYAAVVPGRPDQSEVWLRITDPEDPMPPPDSGLELSPAERELLRRWIAEGAVYEEHWAFVPPVRPHPPAVGDASWPRNPVDRFVLARLEAAGLAPAPEASRESLIRRVTYDLTGLPPTVEEVDAFLADPSPSAYEAVVDRLLASPRYGEHMARAWLDAARFGDTHGYHLDNQRSLWRWRDWVIDAYNSNMPFDRFTVEQLAGDLLPDATLDQRIATGFNRCNPTTGEGGLIDEEYLVKYAADRVETTATVWLGLTMQCAQCHDHKFDPIKQEEFYRFFAFFNSIAEEASDRNALAPPPFVRAPYPEQEAELLELDQRRAEVRKRLDAPMPAADAAQEVWEREQSARLTGRWQPLETVLLDSGGGCELRLLDDGSVRSEGALPDSATYEVLARTDQVGISALLLELIPDESLPQGGVSRASHANLVLSELKVEAVPAGQPFGFAPVALEAAQADYQQQGFEIEKAIDGDPATGWAIDGRLQRRSAVFAAREPFGYPGGTLLRIRLRHESPYPKHLVGRFRLAVSTDPDLRPTEASEWSLAGPFRAEDAAGAFATVFPPEQEGAAAGAAEPPLWTPRPDLADGELHPLEVPDDSAVYLYRTLTAPEPRELRVALGSDDGVRVWLNGELVHSNDVPRALAADQDRVVLPLRAGPNALLVKVANRGGACGFTYRRLGEDLGGLPQELQVALERPAAERTAEESSALRSWFRRRHSPEWAAVADELAQLDQRRAALEAQIPLTMVMEELPEPRPAHFLVRGQYDHPKQVVTRGVPAVLPPLPAGSRPDRLTLARWLVDPGNPLTARVTVNRLWQGLFGAGLVATPEDFGTRGSPPSHPQLLDWLAVEFIESGWDQKALLRLLVTSATYRQDSCVEPSKAARDPHNVLLSRGPRFRLDAEEIRDTALFASGLLVEKIGGPSVKPYQPPGVWKAVGYTSSNTANFVRDEGPALWRRSLYTFWKRTAPPPSMALFDAPSRESCCVARSRTNTPLQALTLLNDVQFVEAARVLAQRVLTEADGTDARLVRAFRILTARTPGESELEVLRQLLASERERYREDPEAAAALVDFGEAPADPELDPTELAAWTTVTSTLLNLDETITRG